MGTKRVSRDERLKQVRAWIASRQPPERYARRIGVKPSTLSWWRWKFQSEGVSLSPRAPARREPRKRALPFVEVTPAPRDVGARPTPKLELQIDDVKVAVPEGFNDRMLARVLGVLRSAR